MAKKLSKSGIATGQDILAWHVTQSVDAFNAPNPAAYDISISGTLHVTGSIIGTEGTTNSLTASYAISASYAETSSVAISASYAPSDVGGSTTQVQFNDGGTLSGDAGFTYDKTLNSITAITNITSSGFISSSSNQSTYYYIDNKLVASAITDDPATARFGYSNNWVNLHYGRSNNTLHKFFGSITASKDISGSNVFTGELTTTGRAFIDSNITASNNISASGDLNIRVITASSHITASGNITAGAVSPITIKDPGSSTSVGFNSLMNQSGASRYNTAIGYATLRDNTTGQYNVAVGHASLPANLDGDWNTAIGFSAMSRHSGSAFNNGNTSIGYKSRYYQRTGQYNVAIGLNANLGGSSNTSNANNNNVMIGTSAGQTLNSGSENTFVGFEAGKVATKAHGNTFIGYQAGVAWAGTSGYGNVYLGWKTGDNKTDGNWNTYLGADIAPSNTGGGTFNETAIGAQTTGIGNNSVALGNTSVSAIKGQVATSTYSDSRIKRNITSGSLGLNFINSLTPVVFQKVNPAEYPEEIRPWNYFARTGSIPDGTGSKEVIIPADPAPPTDNNWYDGLIAQDVSSSLSSFNAKSDIWDMNPNGKQGIKYGILTIPLIKAVQELSAKVTALEAQISSSS